MNRLKYSNKSNLTLKLHSTPYLHTSTTYTTAEADVEHTKQRKDEMSMYRVCPSSVLSCKKQTKEKNIHILYRFYAEKKWREGDQRMRRPGDWEKIHLMLGSGIIGLASANSPT